MRNHDRFSNRVHIVHRVGAALIGLALLVFAVVGLVRGLPWLSIDGAMVFGLSSNGALSLISIVAAAILLGSALWGGPVASTTTSIMGGVFLLSGLIHLAILHTDWNIFAFRLSNVFFSLVVGLVLLVLGVYGRVSGGLPPDNPYRRAHPVRRHRPDPDEQMGTSGPVENAFSEAELAMGEGTASPRQEALVKRELAQRQAQERERAYRNKDRRR